MADVNCQACKDLREEVPQLICDGFDNTMCASLKNDTGLSPTSGHNDCTDLDNLNDCLVGNMGAEVDLYDVCDWRTFMKKFIPNLWTTLKALICAVCGIWTNIHNLWSYARSYRLVKRGNNIVLTASDGDHGSVVDDDTKYSISKSGNKITLTGSDGNNSSVTVNEMDSGIGDREFWSLDTRRSLANDDEVKIKTVTLTKGVWIVVCTAGYESNANGGRGVGITFGSGAHHKGVDVRANTSAHRTIISKTYIRNITETTDVYLDVYQDSGSSLHLETYPDTYVNCVRVA